MSQVSHKKQILPLVNRVLPVDKDTVFLAHYDLNVNDVTGIAPISSLSTLTKDGKFGGGVAIEEGTTNLIPGGTKNMHPSFGNTHGTYNDTHFNAGAFFSIGTITSVVDNVVTFVPARTIRTYDVLRPQTTGGGLTLNVNYFFKMLSPTQFTLHAYDGTADGSKGFAVHDSMRNDIRVPINATDFPTMWWGPPHIPNSGLVKEIIRDGFSHEGRVHDCLRLYTNFRTTDLVYHYLAYGVTPPIEANTQYTLSFYHRAVTPESVGRSGSLQLHNGVYFGGKSFTLSSEWQRFTMTTTSTMSANASMYFNVGHGIVWEISEIQCEQKPFATSFTETTRAVGKLGYDMNQLGISPTGDWTISGWFRRTPGQTSWAGLFNIGSYYQLGQSELEVWTNHAGVCKVYSHQNQVGRVKDLFTPNPGELESWFFAAITHKEVDNLYSFYFWTKDRYIKDTWVLTHTLPITPQIWIGGSPHVFNGVLDEIRIDKVARTEEEIASWYYSNSPFWPKGIYKVGY